MRGGGHLCVKRVYKRELSAPPWVVPALKAKVDEIWSSNFSSAYKDVRIKLDEKAL